MADELPEKIQDVKWDDLSRAEILRALSERGEQVNGFYLGLDTEDSYLILGREMTGHSAGTFLDDIIEKIFSAAEDFDDLMDFTANITDAVKAKATERAKQIGGGS